MTALVGVVAWLVAPPMGRDLAAQVAHGDFWARHGWAVLDFGWYGGVSPFSYSLTTPALMAWLGGGTDGARLLGAIAALAAAVLFVLLLVRTGARRPLLGGMLGAVGIVGNLVSGRVTYTAGLAVGLATLLALTSSRVVTRRVAAVVGGFLTGAFSPVAALFLGLAAVALVASSSGWARRVDGLLVGVGAGASIALMSLLFGVNGPMNNLPGDTLRSATVSIVVLLLVDRRAIRVGGLLSLLGVLAAAVLTTPVGLNAGRLTATFALGVLAGYATVPTWVKVPRRWQGSVPRVATLAALLALVALWQHPFAFSELRNADNPLASTDRFRPLLAELARRQPVGRVEVVPTDAYWEAAYVTAAAPLARGWLRQADTDRNPIFFDGSLNRESYRGWLRENGVTMVAIAKGPVASVGRAEAKLVRSAPPYLTPVWRDAVWTLYQVKDPSTVVSGARVVASTDGGIDLVATQAGDVLIRVRWSRWLSVRGPGACLTPGADGWTTLRVTAPGAYAISGSLNPSPAC